jgi:methyl-accepting chemotaxis protein
MDQATQQNAAMVEESTAASHALAREADGLTQLMGQFTVGHDAPRVALAPRPVERPVAARPRAIPARPGSAALKMDDWEEF